MTREQEERYKDTDDLREVIKALKGMKFKLDCGHHVTFGHRLSNDITIRNSSLKVVCSLCGYEGE